MTLQVTYKPAYPDTSVEARDKELRLTGRKEQSRAMLANEISKTLEELNDGNMYGVTPDMNIIIKSTGV